MNLMPEYLYMYAMENGKTRFLTSEEYGDYRDAVSSMEKSKEQLEQLLEEESLRLFKLYTKSRDKENDCDDLSTFRMGLSMGLKLGAYCLMEH